MPSDAIKNQLEEEGIDIEDNDERVNSILLKELAKRLRQAVAILGIPLIEENPIDDIKTKNYINKPQVLLY